MTRQRINEIIQSLAGVAKEFDESGHYVLGGQVADLQTAMYALRESLPPDPEPESQPAEPEVQLPASPSRGGRSESSSR